MQDRALDYALESGGRLGIGILFGFERLVLLIKISFHHLAQLIQIDTAAFHHRCRIFIIDQREQQMFQRGIFVPPFGCIGERIVQRFLEILSKARHSDIFLRWAQISSFKGI